MFYVADPSAALACTLLDLSAIGARLRTSKQVTKGQVGRMTIKLPDQTEPLLVQATVVRHRPYPEGGCEFAVKFTLQPADELIIINFVFAHTKMADKNHLR